jgi:hypothetical protein
VSTRAYAVTFAAVSFLAALSICTAFERDGLRWSPARELVAQVLRSTKEYAVLCNTPRAPLRIHIVQPP